MVLDDQLYQVSQITIIHLVFIQGGPWVRQMSLVNNEIVPKE